MSNIVRVFRRTVYFVVFLSFIFYASIAPIAVMLNSLFSTVAYSAYDYYIGTQLMIFYRGFTEKALNILICASSRIFRDVYVRIPSYPRARHGS